MNQISHALFLTGFASVSCLICSCGHKKDEPTPEPVQAPVVAKKAPAAQAPAPTANPLDAFATPDDDLKLPTAAQTAEGRDSSIGTGGTSVSQPQPDTSPSIAITPSAPPVSIPAPEKPAKPEDELDPQ